MLDQIHFTARLVVLSDLHIGTGETKTLGELGRVVQPDADADPEVALIFRDFNGTPAVPATAIKGALRQAVAASSDASEAERLFGAIKITEWSKTQEGEVPIDEGQMGTVWLRLARLDDQQPIVADHAPYWSQSHKTAIATHVAIARKTGAADDQKLFHIEYLPSGAEFELRGIVIGAFDDAKRDLAKALGFFASEDGLAVGAGQRFGSGRLRLKGEKEERKALYRRIRFDAATGIVDERETGEVGIAAPSSRVVTERTCILTCRGPYLTIDPARTIKGKNTIIAARSSETDASLPATSFIGALRARAAWLAEIETAEGHTVRSVPADDAFRKPDSWRDDHGNLDPKMLSPVERLFGVSGWRGLIRVVRIEALDGAEKTSLTSIGIDRFTGGTLDSALFSIECFVGARFRVSLVLDRRGEWPSLDDEARYDALMRDFEDDDDELLLGYGSNRGFGWFSVKVATGEGQTA